MSDLVEFLRARLDEDERRAKASSPGPWDWDVFEKDGNWEIVGDEPFREIAEKVCEEKTACFIASWHPARVLAEVDAKRRIIKLVVGAYAGFTVLPQLALPYADHPDYDDAWRPGAR